MFISNTDGILNINIIYYKKIFKSKYQIWWYEIVKSKYQVWWYEIVKWISNITSSELFHYGHCIRDLCLNRSR